MRRRLPQLFPFSRLPAVALLALLPLIAAGPATGLTPLERRVAQAVKARAAAGLALLQRAVDQNSGTMNFDGVRSVGRMFQQELDRLGFETRWVDGAAWGRAGHLVARRRPAKASRRVLLIGHLDTVFEPDSPFQRFERLDDSTARGPGVCDMKGGNVVLLLALQALKDAGALDRLAFDVVLTGDEEKVGAPLELARRDLIESARWADVAIGFEDGDGRPETAVIARRGSTGWILRAWGRAAHSSQVFRPGVGSGAVYESARILSAFHDSLSNEPHLTVNPGLFLGGTTIAHDRAQSRGTGFGKSNVVAESTVVTGDLRALSREQFERARQRMLRIVSRHLPHTGAKLEFDEGYPPLAPSEGNRRLLSLFDRASRDLGHGEVTAVDPAQAGAADVSFCEGLIEMAMDGVGMMGSGGHTVEETADLRTMVWNAERVAVTLLRLGPAGARR